MYNFALELSWEARLQDLSIFCTVEAPHCLPVGPGEKDASVSDGNRCNFQVTGRDGTGVTGLGAFLKVLPIHSAAGGLVLPAPARSEMLLLLEFATEIPFGLWEVENTFGLALSRVLGVGGASGR